MFGRADARIGGKDYHLVFNFSAMAAMERHPFGTSFPSLAAEFAPDAEGKVNLRISSAALMLWGCLRAKHPHVSFDEAGEMLLGPDAQSVTEALTLCLADAFPGESANPPKRAKAGTGKNS